MCLGKNAIVNDRNQSQSILRNLNFWWKLDRWMTLQQGLPILKWKELMELPQTGSFPYFGEKLSTVHGRLPAPKWTDWMFGC